jgi:hypothetical protein
MCVLKAHDKNFSPEKSTKTSMSVPPRFFCFIAFSGASQRWAKKSKESTKESTKKSKQIVSRFCFYHVLGHFTFYGGGSSKTPPKNITKINVGPSPF